MTTTKDNDQSLELLLESLIRMQGRLNEKVAHLHSRINQLEYALQQLPQQEQPTSKCLFCLIPRFLHLSPYREIQ